MSNSVLEGLVKQKDFIFKKQLYKVAKDMEFTIEELLLVIYFINEDKPEFNLPLIKKVTYMDENQIMTSFSSLTTKNIISVNVVKEEDGKINEVIDLTNLYKIMVSEINENIKAKTSENIFNVFEKEFGRTLSPIEFEIINAWLKSGINEELVIGALKEATYNGVSNLRYIDRIIHEWNKKGFKKMEDVNKHLVKKEESQPKELFDYNWLEDSDE